jgi:16S rRNA (guanine527-N7)-methyltransferase
MWRNIAAVCLSGVLLAALLASQVQAFQRTNPPCSFLPARPLSKKYAHTSRTSQELASTSDGEFSTTSASFAMEPDSAEAKRILANLGLSDAQGQQLQDLAELVVEWNERMNLVSRKDCNAPVVFGRHVLPSLAPLGLDDPIIQNDGNQRVADVGTGGGFPGLPLAIAYPNVQFLLVDSIGKKLGAVQDMANRLGLTNVKTHHGRAEAMVDKHSSFDVCVGRSVAAIPKYCFWVQDLLKRDGNIVYLIGGEIEQELLDQTTTDVEIDTLLGHPGASDKRILVFPRRSVKKIAAASGEALRLSSKKGEASKSSSASKPSAAQNNKNKTKKPRGAWEKRESNDPKQRGYDNFQRYDSTR